MTIEGILIGLLAIGIGLAWAFFFGLVAGAQWGQDVFGQSGIFTTVLSWGIGLIFGIVLAAIAYFWYYAAIVIVGGAVGYMLGVGFFEFFGFDGDGIIVVLIGLVVGAVFAIATFLLGVPVLLIMAFSAFSGAAAVVNGVLILIGRIKLDTLNDGIFGSLFADGVIGTVAFLVLGAAALLWQIRDVGDTIQTVDRSAYRY